MQDDSVDKAKELLANADWLKARLEEHGYQPSQSGIVQAIGYALKISNRFMDIKEIFQLIAGLRKRPIQTLSPDEAQLLLAVGVIRLKEPVQQPFEASATKIGRNDKCPCGSGEKYKKCCLELALEHDKLRYAHEKAKQ